MLELIDISKVHRGGNRSVDTVTLRLETGLLGLLGPNGAGKSSLMRIAVLAGGRLRAHGTAGELLRTVNGRVWEATVPPERAAALQARHLVGRTARTQEGVRLRLLAPEPPTAEARPVRPDLEDVYLAVVEQAGLDRAGAR
ncbi:hypothetical protein HC362_05860 [Streptomyces sp. 891-h]|nr:hypothetical protein HC362_05860 [Streptomyces sp. 891-h]